MTLSQQRLLTASQSAYCSFSAEVRALKSPFIKSDENRVLMHFYSNSMGDNNNYFISHYD